MSDQNEVQTQLHAIAQLLRAAQRVGPEAQLLLADLVDELGTALASTAVPNEEVHRLTEYAAHLAQAVQQKHEATLLESAHDRLDGAIVAVEAKAPALADLTRRLAEMLSDVGI